MATDLRVVWGGGRNGTHEKLFSNYFEAGYLSGRSFHTHEGYTELLKVIGKVRQDAQDPTVPREAAKSSRDPAGPANPKTVFVIHGRQLLDDFHAFLRALGLTPLEWSQTRTLTGNPNPYTWEIVDEALSKAGAIVALLTPDDEARLRQHLWSEQDSALEKEYLSQPRQNVLFEAGVAYGRAPQQTILIRVGSHRPMSDLAGHHILQLDDSPQSRQAVADALRTAGCPVDVSGTDWFRSGVFSLVEQPAPSSTQADGTKSDAATLSLYKTQLKGCSDLFRAAEVVEKIQSFFKSHPLYLNAANTSFLEKYPLDFRDQLAYAPDATKKWSLDELKCEVERLQIESRTQES